MCEEVEGVCLPLAEKDSISSAPRWVSGGGRRAPCLASNLVKVRGGRKSVTCVHPLVSNAADSQ